MRYSDRAILKQVDKNEYDYETGEHVYKELYSDIVACFTMDLGLGKSVQIFGDYNKQRKVIFLKNAYNKPFNVVEYRGKRYIPTTDKQLSKAFYLERDDSDGTKDIRP
jgi:hypothetical protein